MRRYGSAVGEPPPVVDPRRWGSLIGVAGGLVFVTSYSPALGTAVSTAAWVGAVLLALATVLGHELSHVTQRHISRLVTQEKRQAPWVIGAMILGALATRKNPDAANAVISGSQAVAVQGQLNFSRDMEREADRIGFGVLTQAGFDPQGFVTMFDKLQQAARLNDNGSFPYLRTHPMTTERSADLQARLQLAPRDRALVSVDGLDLESLSTTNITPPVTAVAARPGRPLVVADQGGTWTLPLGGESGSGTDVWQAVPGFGASTVPAYPG